MGCLAAIQPEPHTGWGVVPSAHPRQNGGGAAQMAQMARVGFRTIGSCAGHQVTAAQLAALPARRMNWGEKLLSGRSRGLRGTKVLVLL